MPRRERDNASGELGRWCTDCSTEPLLKLTYGDHSMQPRKIALAFGLFNLIIGVLALVPSLTGSSDGLPAIELSVSYGRFLDIFALNLMNKLALVAVGIAGIMASTSDVKVLVNVFRYFRAVCVLSLAMAILGLIPQTNTVFGLWPLFGEANVIASLVFAAVSGSYAYYLSTLDHAETIAHLPA